MKNARQLLWGILITLISLILILGGVSLSLAEGNASSKTKAPTTVASSTYQLFTAAALSTDSGTPPVVQQDTPTTDTPELVIILDTPAEFTDTALPAIDTPSVISATPPAATSTSMSTFAPRTPRATATPAATRITCGAPAGWVTYIVQPGDTLYRLSQLDGVSIAVLQKANCMGTSTALKAGQKLLVPPGAKRSPSSTPVANTPTWTIPPLPTSIP